MNVLTRGISLTPSSVRKPLGLAMHRVSFSSTTCDSSRSPREYFLLDTSSEFDHASRQCQNTSSSVESRMIRSTHIRYETYRWNTIFQIINKGCIKARLNESNILQHVGPCNIWYALLLAWALEMFVQHHPTSSNIVFKPVQHCWTNNGGRCWSNMLDSFKCAFRCYQVQHNIWKLLLFHSSAFLNQLARCIKEFYNWCNAFFKKENKAACSIEFFTITVRNLAIWLVLSHCRLEDRRMEWRIARARSQRALETVFFFQRFSVFLDLFGLCYCKKKIEHGFPLSVLLWTMAENQSDCEITHSYCKKEYRPCSIC